MKKLFLLTVLICATTFVNAQEVVATAGETQSASGFEINWTLGEPVIQTISSGSSILTQGFHQSKLTVTSIDEILSLDFELKVYPNPTSEFLIIFFNKPDVKSSYSLFDLSGKLLDKKTISASETQINLKNYASGTYILKLYQNPSQPLQTYKIVKE